jgi:hypothetical protein
MARPILKRAIPIQGYELFSVVYLSTCACELFFEYHIRETKLL